MYKKIIIISFILSLMLGSWGLLRPVQAAAPTSIISTTTSAYQTGNYKISDFIVLAIRISKMILGFVGSLALIMFIYGGIMLLISAGSADTVNKAKKIITAAVIGLIIVFSSYLIIKFVLSSMGLNWNGSGSTAPLKYNTTTTKK